MEEVPYSDMVDCCPELDQYCDEVGTSRDSFNSFDTEFANTLILKAASARGFTIRDVDTVDYDKILWQKWEAWEL
jgi:hypothetical protein